MKVGDYTKVIFSTLDIRFLQDLSTQQAIFKGYHADALNIAQPVWLSGTPHVVPWPGPCQRNKVAPQPQVAPSMEGSSSKVSLFNFCSS